MIALAGIITLFEMWQIGIVFLLASIPFFIPKRFREVNLQKRLHRVGLGIGKQQLGSWKPFPQNINYVSVMRLKQKSTIHTAVGISAQSSTNIYVEYQVNLIYDKRSRFKIGIGANLEETMVIADKCSSYLKKDTFVLEPGKKYWKRYEAS